mmetsp:Transcript_127478/g.366717  ORF Transcript_127478/g.366717 Transcript_127478/m.366717 type:complete len:92 (+) Transcript_127478:1011-1286(+)
MVRGRDLLPRGAGRDAQDFVSTTARSQQVSAAGCRGRGAALAHNAQGEDRWRRRRAPLAPTQRRNAARRAAADADSDASTTAKEVRARPSR